MRWKAIAGLAGALALAAGPEPVRAAGLVWIPNGINFPTVSVTVMIPPSWRWSHSRRAYMWQSADGHNIVIVALIDRPQARYPTMDPNEAWLGNHPQETDGFPGWQLQVAEGGITEFVRSVYLPDRTTLRIAGLFTGAPGPSLALWHRIIAPLRAPYRVITYYAPKATTPQGTLHMIGGTTFQYGTPAMQVRVTGPTGSYTTWALLDTGNENLPTITPEMARILGLQEVRVVPECGVNACSAVPEYTGITVRPYGHRAWILRQQLVLAWRGQAGNGIYATLDIGPHTIPDYHLQVSGGRWTLTWRTP